MVSQYVALDPSGTDLRILCACSNSARFLWKSIPSMIKDSRADVVAAWKIGQHLWTRDYAVVYDAIRGFDWSQEAQALVAAFSGKCSCHKTLDT